MTARLRPIFIVNFKRFNPPPSSLSANRRKSQDGLPLRWVRWETDAHRNGDILDLPARQRWLWPTLLGLAGRGSSHGVVKMSPAQLAREADLPEEEVVAALTHLWKRGLIRFTPPDSHDGTTHAPHPQVTP